VDTQKKPALTVSQKLPMTLNNVRVPIECRLELVDPQGKKNAYVLTASCKSEQVWVQDKVWHQPNADMCVIASEDQFLVFKRWDKCNKGVMRYPTTLGVQPERQLERAEAAFDRFSIDLHWVDRAGCRPRRKLLRSYFPVNPLLHERNITRMPGR
jgi:hypothetical protein